jgi:hypothetical protein
MAKFIIIDVSHNEELKASQDLKKNLVLDAGGEIVDCNALGLVVECKKTLGKALDLVELIELEEVTVYA